MKIFTWYYDAEKGQKELADRAALDAKPWQGFPSGGKTEIDWGPVLSFAFIAVPIFSGICLVVWQIYRYLRYDVWTTVSVIDALQWSSVKWAHNPTDWLGLYRILDLMPLSLALPSIGITITMLAMLVLAHNQGVRQGFDSAKSMQSVPEDKGEPEENTEAEARLEAFETGLAEANLFAYELSHGLVPDGNSESNPGYGPLDFDEWREWKQRGFEQAGNLWFNHPDGLPPKENDAA
jgi:hypothetical protein